MSHGKVKLQQASVKTGAQARGSTTSRPSKASTLTFSVCKAKRDRKQRTTIRISSHDTLKQLKERALQCYHSRKSPDGLSLVWYDQEADEWRRTDDNDPSIAIEQLKLPLNCLLSIDVSSPQSLVTTPQSSEVNGIDYELTLKLCLKPMDSSEVTVMKTTAHCKFGQLRQQAYQKFHRAPDEQPLFQWKGDQWVRFPADMDQSLLADLPFESDMFTSLDHATDDDTLLVAPGLCGLTNLGSTCFMNSIFQCLSHTPPFAKTVLALSDDIDSPVLGAYIQLMKRMWSGQDRSIKPLTLLENIRDYLPRYTSYRQQDAQEFMNHFLHLIDDELTNKETLIKKLFYGQLQSTVTCLGCQRTEATNESISFLPLPLNSDQSIRVLFVKSNGEQQSVSLQIDSSVTTVNDLIDCFIHQCDIKSDRENLEPYRLVENNIREPYETWTLLAHIRDEQVALLEYPKKSAREKSIWCHFRDASTNEFFRPSIVRSAPMSCRYIDIADHIDQLWAHLCSITHATVSDCHLVWIDDRRKRIPLSLETKQNEPLPNLASLEINMAPAFADVYRDHLSAHRASDSSSLESLLGDFFADHSLHGRYRCSKCSQATQARQASRLSLPLPHVLILQLKRFTYDSHSYEKINTYVSFPLNELNLIDYLAKAEHDRSRDPSSTTYDLVAVANHMGTMSSGHYTTFAKYCANDQWYSFDDTSVQRLASAREVITRNAYILVYVRRKAE